jgi:O-antigen/teichoic acid export membrane protein
VSARKLVSGFALLMAATLLTQVIGFAALAVAARRLGPEHLGAATFVLTLAIYIGIPANFGLTVLAMREIAAEPERRRIVIGEVLTLRALLGAAGAGVFIALAPVLAADDETRELIPLAALALAADVITGEWVLMALGRPAPVALARLLGQGIYGVLVVVALGEGEEGARLFVLLSALSILIVALVTLGFAVRELGLPAARLSLAASRRRLLASAPFGWGAIMLQVYLGSGMVLLGYLGTAASVGEYAVAQKIPAALLGLVGLWAVTLYAHSARMIGPEPDRLRRHVDSVVGLSVAVALPLAIGGSLCGEDLMVRLFGTEYGSAGTPFALLIWALAIAAVNVHFGAVLGAAGDERRYAANIAVGSVVCIVLGFALTASLEATGPAIGVIAAELTILVLMGGRYLSVVGPVAIDWRQLAATIAATGLMSAALVLLDDLDVLLRILAATTVFALAAAALGIVPREILRRAAPADG